MKWIAKIKQLPANRYRSYIRAYIGLFFIYGVTKSIIYFAPLFLYSTLKDTAAFGAFEYSLNLGQTLATVAGLGMHGAYTFFIYKQKKQQLKPLLHLVYLVPPLLLLLLVLAVPALLENTFTGSIIIGFAFAQQLFAVTFYKLQHQNIKATIADTGIYLLLFLFTALIYSGILDYRYSRWTVFVLAYLLLMNFRFHFRQIKGVRRLTRQDWKPVFRYGVYSTVVLLLVSLLTTSTRIFAEFFTSLEQIGVYSYLIRIASVIIIFHRVIQTLFYTHIYTSPHQRLDRLFAIVLAAVLFFAAAGYFLPELLKGARYPLIVTILHNRALWHTVLFQAVLWTGFALMDLVLYRENLLGAYVKVLAMIVLLMAATFWTVHLLYPLSMQQITWINALFIGAATLAQCSVLKRKGIYYKYTIGLQWILLLCFLVMG
ncbi:hypothetical protein A8C56_07940 [Niabella ginsenosidivorans]|uniref:Polysaccharide biosynthesis protein n=1 Tax=Niabella ginsenosidivorans TaxID=1176587 RepID=A0A1A9I2I3_9BACT|nr:hypothetical protein A8C56_07940 [Niabella ginsenosidivorans]